MHRAIMKTRDETAPAGHPRRLVVFDCDGTLVDSQRTIVGAMNRAFDGLNFPRPSEDAVRRVIGLSLSGSMARLLPEGSARDHERLIEGYRSAFLETRSAPDYEEPLYPGVVEALDHVEGSGMLAGVATGKSLRGLEATLRHHGIDDRFVTLQTADWNPGKPHPAMVQRAIAEAGAEPGTTVVVGDTTYDMEMARAAGAYAVGVSWGYHPVDELRAAGAHAVIDRFQDLAGVLTPLLDGR